jgi:hypothetical protein
MMILINQTLTTKPWVILDMHGLRKFVCCICCQQCHGSTSDNILCCCQDVILAYPQFQWLQQAMKLAVAYDLQVQIVHFNLIFVSLMFDVIRI